MSLTPLSKGHRKALNRANPTFRDIAFGNIVKDLIDDHNSVKADTEKQATTIAKLQVNKIDAVKNLFAGLSTDVVSNYGTTGGLTNTVTNGILTSSKTISTPSVGEGVDILVDLSTAVSFGQLTLSFNYAEHVYSGDVSNQLLISLCTTAGVFKKTLGAIAKDKVSGTYSLNITNDINTYGLQAGFKIRISTRDIYSIKISNFVVGTSVVISDNPIRGKTIYGDGDSIALGAGADDVSYLDLIAEENEMFLTKSAVGGTTIAVRDGRNDSILERVKAHTGYYDYIVLEGGINDVFQAVPLGTLSSGYDAVLDETTFLGAMESLCKELNTVHFGQKCLFVLIHKKPGTANQATYFDAAITSLEKWSVPYIDLRKETNLAAWTETIGTTYFQEAAGTHPLLNTYKKYYVPLITSRMKTL